MSKKNNKSTKRKAHDFDIQREKEEAAKRAKKLEKKQSAGVQKVKKSKAIRIRKGVVVKGIKVVDAETKQKVKSALLKAKKAKAKSQMEVDEPAPPRVKRTKAAGGKAKKAGDKDAMDTA